MEDGILAEQRLRELAEQRGRSYPMAGGGGAAARSGKKRSAGGGGRRGSGSGHGEEEEEEGDGIALVSQGEKESYGVPGKVTVEIRVEGGGRGGAGVAARDKQTTDTVNQPGTKLPQISGGGHAVIKPGSLYHQVGWWVGGWL